MQHSKPEASFNHRTPHTNTNGKDGPEDVHCICRQPWDPKNPVFMIECHICKTWFHGDCINLREEDALCYLEWHCKACSNYHGPSKLKSGIQGFSEGKSSHSIGLRKRKRIDFASLHDAPKDDIAWADLVEVDYIKRLKVREKAGKFGDATKCIASIPEGESFSSEYVNRFAFERPIRIESITPELGLSVPGPDFSVLDVARLGGKYRQVIAIELSTQRSIEYTLEEWAEYFSLLPSQRERVLNIISFEFSKTRMNDLVTPPKFARDADFVNLHWPTTALLENARPRVSKYCLMGAAGSFTDFHVDFGGTSVWYHVLKGKKIFYFVMPTTENLNIYAKWSVSGKQDKQFLGDLVSNCYKVVVQEGNTLFIPAGWIHAVYTPKDSIVFGGNFVHKHSLKMQLDIYNLEEKMKVKKEYRFPNYEALMWYCAKDFAEKDFDNINALPLHVLTGLKCLSEELMKWCKSKKHEKQFPIKMDVLKVATELRALLNKCDFNKKSLSITINRKRLGDISTLSEKGPIQTPHNDKKEKKPLKFTLKADGVKKEQKIKISLKPKCEELEQKIKFTLQPKQKSMIGNGKSNSKVEDLRGNFRKMEKKVNLSATKSSGHGNTVRSRMLKRLKLKR